MAKKFADVAEQYGDTDEGNKSSVRALQAWQYLIGKAKNRQSVKYDELANLMEFPFNLPLGSILGHIAYYCQQNELPALTCIVVNSGGRPGEGFPLHGTDIDAIREETFNYNWFSIYPPTPAEFKAAWDLYR